MNGELRIIEYRPDLETVIYIVQRKVTKRNIFLQKKEVWRDLALPLYRTIVNEVRSIKPLCIQFRHLGVAKNYLEAVKDYLDIEPLKIGGFTFIPILQENGWGNYIIKYYVKGVVYRQNRHHKDYHLLGSKTACEYYVKKKTFKPQIKVL